MTPRGRENSLQWTVHTLHTKEKQNNQPPPPQRDGHNAIQNMSLTIPNLVPKRPFCYLNFISVAKPQKIGNETFDAHVLVSSKTYRKQNKPKKWIPNPLRYMSF